MNPWSVLFARMPELVSKLEAEGHPLLTVEVDGEVAAWLVRPRRADLEVHARWPGMPLITAGSRLITPATAAWGLCRGGDELPVYGGGGEARGYDAGRGARTHFGPRTATS